jgi:hypothetical protein
MSELGWYLYNNTHGSDLVNLTIVLIVSYLIRPLVARTSFFAADRNRWPIVPMVLGLALGMLAEYARFLASGNFFPSVGIRRGLAAGCGAALVILLSRVFFHRAGSSYRMDPAPRR